MVGSFVCWFQGRSSAHRRDGVDADAALGELLRERAREGDDRACNKGRGAGAGRARVRGRWVARRELSEQAIAPAAVRLSPLVAEYSSSCGEPLYATTLVQLMTVPPRRIVGTAYFAK